MELLSFLIVSENLLSFKYIKRKVTITWWRSFFWKNEYLRIKSSNDSEFAVDWLKKGIVLAAKGIEIGNNAFDPLGVDLNGWGDQMQLEKDTYNDVLSELYEKYKGGGAMSPEIKLLLMFSLTSF